MIKFYKVYEAECDFCKKTQQVVTQANYIYICRKCAVKINRHARNNEQAVRDATKQ